MPKTTEAKHVAGQLLRSGTSPGANEEACGAESQRDFVHKLGIVLKELKETRYWLHICAEVPLVKPTDRLEPLLDENEQLVAIVAKSRSTALRRGKTRPPAKPIPPH